MDMKSIRLVLAGLLLGSGAWAAAISGNFNGADGDGKQRAELAVYDPNTGNWFIRSLDGTLLAFGENWGWNATHPAPGDFNGDGNADLSVYQREAGAWFIKTLGDNQPLAIAHIWGDVSMISVPADYDGDGVTDMGVYQVETGTWFIRTMDGRLLAFAYGWGGPGMTPVPADFNGDGAAELAVYQRSTGNWFIKTLGTDTLLAFGENWGTKGMQPVPADFDGDGMADLAVYDPSSGRWFARTLGDNRLLLFAEEWGWDETCPTPGDYDGDGTADLAVYHRASGSWFIRTMSQTLLAFAESWGLPGQTVPTATYAHRGAAGRILMCFGDSITYGTSSSSNGPETGYPALLERKLEINYGGHFVCLNYGDPGERTGDGADRLPGALDENPDSDTLLLMEGTNDALYDSMFTQTEDNLRSMLNAALTRGLKTVIATIPPVISTSSRNRSQQMSRIQSFNPTIYTLADETGSQVAKVYEALTSVSGWESSLIDQDTANHPNDAGYQYVRDAFFNAVSPIVTGED